MHHVAQQAGAVVFCSVLCSCIFLRQWVALCVGRVDHSVFWGKMFLLWSCLHITAAFQSMMWPHLLWLVATANFQAAHVIWFQ